MPDTLQKHSLWVGLWQAALGLFVGIVVASFLFGRQTGDLRQKIGDVVQWKAEAMPRIERMDRQGSLSFENFKTQYDKEQAKQYERLKELETEVNHLDQMQLRIDRLEGKLGRDHP